jgi:hypothetical protein
LSFLRQVGIGPGDVGRHLLGDLTESVKNNRVRKILRDRQAAMRSVLDRLSVRCISWQDLSSGLSLYVASLGESRGDRTLKRLIDGLRIEIPRHPLTNVDKQSA